MRSNCALGRLAAAAVMLLCCALWAPSAAAAPPRAVRVGVLVDGPAQKDAPWVQTYRKELVDLLAGEFETSFPETAQRAGQQSMASLRSELDALLADPEVDVVIALGLMAGQVAAQHPALSKPVFAPISADAQLQDFPQKEGASGKENFAYLAEAFPFEGDLKAFRDVVDYEQLAVFVDAGMLEGIPVLAERASELAKAIGVTLLVVPVQDRADAALAAIPKEADAVYVAPLIQFGPGDKKLLFDGLIERKLPSFSRLGAVEVEQGVLSGRVPKHDLERRARRVALQVQSALLGDAPASLPYTFESGEALTLNMATARAIGHFPRWKILTEAQLINPERKQVDRVIDLRNAVKEALRHNRDLRTAIQKVEVGEQDVAEAYTALFPQMSLATNGVVIDEDRAASSFGSNPERTMSVSASLQQLLFSERAWANVTIQETLQEERDLERIQIELDVSSEAATAYLDVLRAKTIERVQRTNLRQTRSNLELAQIRVKIGTANRAEVFRWESQIARDRNEVINTSAQRNLAEMDLNRILNAPLEESFVTAASLGEDPAFTNMKLAPLFRYMEDPWSFRRLREYLVQEALERAPELQRIDKIIAVRRRALASSKRRFWVPQLALSGELSHRFVAEGAGTSGLSAPPGAGIPPGLFPDAPDDTNWNVAASLSLPIFQGGERFVAMRRDTGEIVRLQYERQATAQRIEQRVRSAMHIAGASRASIDLTEASATAARQSFELFTDAYARGVTNIVTLLDSQNAALQADLAAANALFTFYVDLVGVMRAVAYFPIFDTDKRCEAYLEKMQAWFSEQSAEQSSE